MSVITNSLAMMDTSSAITNLDADMVAYDNTTSGLSATDAQAAIDELSSDISNISSPDADDVSFTKPQNSIYGANTDNVQEALEDINTTIAALDTTDVAVPFTSRTGIYANATTAQAAFDAVKTNINDILKTASVIGDIPSLHAANVFADTSCDGILQPFYGSSVTRVLEGLGGYLTNLNSTQVSLPSASKTGIYASADDVQEALDAIKTALDSGGGGGGSVDASDVSFNYESEDYGCWGGSCAGNVEAALFDIDERLSAVISYNWDIDRYEAASSVVGYVPIDGILAEQNIDNVEDALEYLSTYIDNLPSGGGGSSSATDVSYTKPQNSIYGANTDTVKEALDDVSTVIQALDSTDIAVPSASRTGIYANTATVQAALDAIKTAISSGGGGSSSASNVSFTRPQGGIYYSSTDTVQEALEDVSAKVLDLAASDIAFGSGCGGKYPLDVETVEDALECLQSLLFKYSDSEEETGWLWFNDKPIYQISVEPESGTINLFDTNELEIDDLVYMEATLTNSGGTKRWTISGSSGDFYWNTETHKIVYGGSDVVTTATIRYTKTSD